MSKVPNSTPKMNQHDVARLALPYIKHLDADEKVYLVGMRGYYKDTMGKPGVNDRGIYDDAIFVVGPDCFVSFNANTDPSAYRKGKGTGASKGMASLAPGLHKQCWYIGHHKKIKPALRQCAPVVVIRDGIHEDYPHKGMHMINMHPGGVNGTSSLGCQTIPRAQWPAFISLVQSQMKKHGQKYVSYILIEA